ncbi:MAG: PIN domain-containing protein [Candidatus Methanomethyliaceae archaeon]|nr:PIN domain-containing protein [Candidatus Methanomethyliaceae archaeon]MDW7971075.1 PIN domain-containing protein [Nitrososphaerota archaeon]
MRRKNLKKKNSKVISEGYVVDTSVLVEYILRGAPQRIKVEELFNSALKKQIELYITPTTISELLYVVSKIYEMANVAKANEEALNYVRWLMKRAKITEITADIAIKAGELKKKLKVALSDCYVIATAIDLQTKALFLRQEKEMSGKNLENLPMIFLNQIK